MDWKDPRLLVYILFFFFTAITTIGLVDLSPDFRVEPEYFSGILTASAILFGFYVVLIQKEPKEEQEKWRLKHLVGRSFILSFLLLMLSIVAIYYTALEKIPSPISLWICMFLFLMNAFITTMVLYFQRFRG